jgi:hypothetical protein
MTESLMPLQMKTDPIKKRAVRHRKVPGDV